MQDETVAATMALSLLVRRCVKSYILSLQKVLKSIALTEGEHALMTLGLHVAYVQCRHVTK